MKRIFALLALLVVLLALARHTKAQNFAGTHGGIFTNVTVTSSNAASAQLILAKIPDGVIPGCVTFFVKTNGTTAAFNLLPGTNSVSGGGTPIPAGTGIAYCNPPLWQFAFWGYLDSPGTAIVSVAFNSLTNAP